MAEEDATTCKWGFTVKSKLHWLSIMKEWEWEGMYLNTFVAG
jgi:hypothetical protein